MIAALNIMTTVCIGLLIGTELAVSVFVNPVLNTLDDLAQASAIRLFAQRLGTAMPFWYTTSLLLLIVEAVLHFRESGDLLLIVACAIWSAAIIYTLVALVPINNRMTRLSSDAFPPEAKQEHRKWDKLHRWRVVALTATMVCFLVAVRT